MFDAMAQRYGVLPSFLLTHGDSFDLMVMDVGVTYQNYKQSGTKDTSFYSQDNLKDIMYNRNK